MPIFMDPLYNPVFSALTTLDKAFARGNDNVKFFDEEVSPFASFKDGYEKGFDELHSMLPQGRRILYPIPHKIEIPRGWKCSILVDGLQFIYDAKTITRSSTRKPESLNNDHISEMVELARLTKPGPFNSRTIEFGFYHGFFENGRLAAMAGQRLHLTGHTEVSAVCTHPDFLGKGYAAALIEHQIEIILSQGKIPFLHVRADNSRAIAIYERLGFRVNREMNFYFMKRE